MLALHLAPVFLLLAVLAAHFFRAAAFGLLAVTVILIALLFVPRVWAARAVQVGLVLGALEWGRTLVLLVAERRAVGAPYSRLAVILGVVAVATAAASLIFRSAPVRRYFGLGAARDAPSPER